MVRKKSERHEVTHFTHMRYAARLLYCLTEDESHMSLLAQLCRSGWKEEAVKMNRLDIRWCYHGGATNGQQTQSQSHVFQACNRSPC
jgi:hypothetical protein